MRRNDHVLRQVGARAASLAIEISVALTEGVIHIHPEIRNDGTNDFHRSFNLEVIADRRPVEHDLALLDAPHLAKFLIAERRLESERVEELDAEPEALHARLHFLARL